MFFNKLIIYCLQWIIENHHDHLKNHSFLRELYWNWQNEFCEPRNLRFSTTTTMMPRLSFVLLYPVSKCQSASQRPQMRWSRGKLLGLKNSQICEKTLFMMLERKICEFFCKIPIKISKMFNDFLKIHFFLEDWK